MIIDIDDTPPRPSQQTPLGPRTSQLTEPKPADFPSLTDVLRIDIPTMKHIPNGARTIIATCLAKIIDQMVLNTTWESAIRLIAFAKFILPAGSRGGKKKQAHNRSEIIMRTISYPNLPIPEIWTEILNRKTQRETRPTRNQTIPTRRSPNTRGITPTSSDPEFTQLGDKRTISQISQLIAEGAYTKAVKLLSSSGMHDPNDPVILKTLQQLHPTGKGTTLTREDSNTLHPQATDAYFETDTPQRLENIRRAIASFPNATGCGPSGLRAQHLQEITAESDLSGSAALLQSLDQLFAHMIQGDIAPALTEALCSARLFPLKKGNGGTRPIAVGDTLRRLAEKVFSSLPATRDAMTSLLPRQCGFAGKNACEQVALTIQDYITQRTKTKDNTWALLQVDITNAFNSIHRQQIIQETRNRCPHLTLWAQASLQPSHLFCGENIIKSTEGAQQGAPLSPLFFALGIHPIISDNNHLTPLNHWYLDDGNIIGDLNTLDNIMRTIAPKLASIGCLINTSKTTLWGPGAHPEAIRNLPEDNALQHIYLNPYTPGSGTKVLGVPIHQPGNTQFVRDHLEAKHEEHTKTLKLLTGIPHAQLQHTLLRFCLDACKLTWTLRTSPTLLHQDILQRTDLALRATLGKIIGSELSDTQWAQAKLPLRQGGLGIRSPADIAAASRIAAYLTWLDSAEKNLEYDEAGLCPLIDEQRLIQQLSTEVGTQVDPVREWGTSKKIAPTDGPCCSQQWWTEKAAIRTKQRISTGATPRDEARLHHQKGPIATGWMSVRPSEAAGTLIDSPTYRTLLKWHLGQAILPDDWGGGHCPLQCSATVDIYGDHIVTCKRNKLWERHLGIQSYISRCLLHSGIPYKCEVSMNNDTKRDADILLQRWENGAGLAIDVAVCHSTPPSMPNISTTHADSLLANRADRKRAKYQARCTAIGARFEPLVLSTWGTFSPGGESTWRDIVRRLATSYTGGARHTRIAELHQGLSVALMRGVGKQLQTLTIAHKRGYIDAVGNTHAPHQC
jgi:hypothetical protein